MTQTILCFNRKSGDLGIASISSHRDIAIHAGWNGLIAAQSNVNPSHIYDGIHALNNEVSPLNAMEDFMFSDDLYSGRQFAMIDSFGRIGVHSGSQCEGASFGTHFDEYWSLCVISHHATPYVASTMLDAFLVSAECLPERLISSLHSIHNGEKHTSSALTIISGKDGRKCCGLTVKEETNSILKLRELFLSVRANVSLCNLQPSHQELLAA